MPCRGTTLVVPEPQRRCNHIRTFRDADEKPHQARKDHGPVLSLLASLAEFPHQSVPAFDRLGKPLDGSEVLEGVLSENCWGTRRQVRHDYTSSAIGRIGLDCPARAPEQVVVLTVTKRI